jgi:penicillin amidase
VKAHARRVRQALQIGNGLAAVTASACLLGLFGTGFAAVPAIGRALVPGHGAWTSAAGAQLPVSHSLTLAGLTGPAQVAFTKQGLASITARSDDDAYLALGYVHAEFRLTEMDLERRLAEGRLAQLVGPSAVASDTFELRLGLLRTAQREWATMPASSAAARALVAYSRGVNDYLAQVRSTGRWPAEFSLAGMYPANWTPVDSLAVQGELTQELDFTTTPLDYALLARSLGLQHTMQWFGILPPNRQSPYDPGPYRNLGLAPIAGAQTVAAAPVPARGPVPAGAMAAGVAPASVAAARAAQPVAVPASLGKAAAAILAQTNGLPAGQLYSAPASNAWAANGPKVAGGGAMLAGDPHLPQTLPSVWYQAALSAPGLAVSGVTMPGLPGVLIGHNAHIAWSLTDTQSQATLFYAEQTSSSRPRQYFWRGQWRRMQVLHYTVPVRGGSARQVYVEETVHGPVLTRAGQTVAVDWMGAVDSPDLQALLGIESATDFSQFRAALANWRAPALNFVYADDHGNIGAISAGYYPEVRHGEPWLPMPGMGADDIAGVIPYAAVPQVYDPSSHVIATANQRPVGPSYPYYIGTTASFFDPGYRADAEYAFLGRHWSMKPASFAALQDDLSDRLAGEIVPKLLAALKLAQQRNLRLTPLQQMAVQALASWNGQMDVNSGAASIWWTFWTDYLTDVFQPWWTAAKVPVGLDRGGLAIGPDQFSLDETLEAWTLGDQQNAAFTPPAATPPSFAAPPDWASASAPTGAGRSASASASSAGASSASAASRRGHKPTPAATPAQVEMVRAFLSAVQQLSLLLGGGPGKWQWGKLHTRQFPSLTQATALGYGPRPASGDIWTVDASEGGMTSDIGPSWRMVAMWSRSGQPIAEAIYPGGQSEDPASPWYANLIGDWWAGRYVPMPGAAPGRVTGHAVWELRP